MKLKGKVAIVTGGAHGLGRAYCLGLAREGARVVVADIDEKKAVTTAQEIEAEGGKAKALKVDVSIPGSTQEMAKKTVECFGKIDVLVNNAAIYRRPAMSVCPFYDLDLDEWDRVIAVNLKGPFLCIRAVFPYMRKQSKGKIINVTSNLFFSARDNFTHYIASKGGVVGLTRALAKELGQFNININCIAPGSTLSEEPSDEALEYRKRVLPMRAIQRVEVPEDLVGTIVFLASSDSDFITGQTIVVDGGRVLH